MFAGVIPILATPFYDDDRLDLESWQRLLDFMVVLGVDGITILGVLGESNRLNDEERQTLIETAVAVIARRVPIIVGASATGTRTAVSLASMAQDLGANAVMVTPAKEAVTRMTIVSSSSISTSRRTSRSRSCCRIILQRPTYTCRSA